MILMVAVDDNNGMMFNKRRQSQDRVLRDRIRKLCANGRLWVNHYTDCLLYTSDAADDS